MKLTIKEIIDTTHGTLKNGNEVDIEKEISNVITDSRKVTQDCLYIPFVGERVDGHDFVGSVMDNGALMCLSEKELQVSCPYILVENTAVALKEIAAFYRGKLSSKIVGIIGSVGKTSTKEMVSSVLSTRFNVQKTMGNFNNEIGCPLTVLSIRDEHDVSVVEMGISDFDEMTRLANIVRPDIVCMTNIGYSHLEKLHTRDGILKAKTEVLPYIKENGLLVLNGDDDKLSTITERDGLKILRYGIEGVEDFEGGKVTPREELFALASGLELTSDNFEKARFTFDNRVIDAVIPIPGEHNVQNALAAVIVGAYLGLTDEEIKEGIEKVETIAGRNNRIEVNGITIIDDCYNANPVSMKAALKVLSSSKGRKFAVLGDMGELGDDTAKLHYGVGKFAAECNIDIICLVGELSKNIALGALENGTSAMVCHYNTKEELSSFLQETKRTGDTILVKASQFMQFETIVESLKR